MKTVLRRKDHSSIFCPPIIKKSHAASSVKLKATELIVAFLFIAAGLFIIINF